jgi:hypothetical protein
MVAARRKLNALRFAGRLSSHPLHKTIHHALLAGAVELDRQLVAVDGGDVAVAEFLMKHAVAEREGGDGAGGFGDQFAFDGERQAAGAVAFVAGPPRRRRGALVEAVAIVLRVVARAAFGKAAAAAALFRLGALPARRVVAGAEGGGGVEARGAIAAHAAEAGLRLRHFDMGFRQFVEEARRNIGLPQPVHAPVGGEIDFRPFSRPR